jgi:hypothetical protein
MALTVASGYLLHLAAGNFVEQGAWVVAVSVLVMAAPIALSSIYISTAEQARRLEGFAARGWIHFFVSRRPLKVLLWTLYAFASAHFTLLQFYAYEPRHWAAFFLVAPVLVCAYFLIRRFAALELKRYLVDASALRYARIAASATMAALYLVVLLYVAPPETPHATLAEAIDHERRALTTLAGSAIVFESANAMGWYNGIKAYAHGALGEAHALPAMLLIAVGSLVVFFNACSILACFLIPAVEYRRVFGPLTAEPEPPPVAPGRIALISAVTTVLALFIYVPAVAMVEARLQSDPRIRERRAQVEAVANRAVEQIDQAFYREGTIARVFEARQRLLSAHAASRERVEAEANAAFDQLAEGVEPFLDWYYSLTAEYLRIGNALTGNLEDYLRDKLAEHLGERDAFARVEAAINQALAEHEGALAEYREYVGRILEANRIDMNPSGAPVLAVESMEDLLTPPLESIRLEQRMGAAGGGALVAGTLTAAIVGKILAKSGLKFAAQAVAKVVASKSVSTVAGAGAGAAAGAAVGSVVPVVGTAVGAAVGGVVGGIATAVGVDAGLLKLEEAWNRDAFRTQLLEAIEMARTEFMERLHTSPESATR